MIDAAFARELADEWIAAWNAHDLQRVLSHYRDDFEMGSPFIRDIAGEPSGVLRGKPAVAAYWEKALAMHKDLKFTLLHVLVGARSVALHYRNHRDRLVIEVLELDDERRVVRAAAHY